MTAQEQSREQHTWDPREEGIPVVTKETEMVTKGNPVNSTNTTRLRFCLPQSVALRRRGSERFIHKTGQSYFIQLIADTMISVSFQGPKLFNTLGSDIKNTTTLTTILLLFLDNFLFDPTLGVTSN